MLVIAESDRADIARRWTCEVSSTSYVPLPLAEIEAFLGTCLDDLVAALSDDPFDSDRAAEVGARLARAHLTNPLALDRTLNLLVAELPRVSRIPTSEILSRLGAVTGSVAAGYARQLRETVLDEQEVVQDAVMQARENAEEALRASERRFRAVFSSSALGIAIADLAGQVIEANRALHAITDTVPGEAGAVTSVYDLATESGLHDLQRHEAELVGGGRDRYQVVTRFRIRDEREVWTQVSASLVRDAHGEPEYQVLLVENVTDRVLLQNELHRQATHDPLTGLPNRTLLRNRLEEALLGTWSGRRVGLCYFDLDGFKAINDSLGHPAGDDFLRAVAQRLQHVVRMAGGMAVRMGGDEFVVLVPDSPGTAPVVALVERAMAEITRPVRVGRHDLSAEASVGIVERPVADTDADELLQDADLTLYRAKTAGRGRWVLFDTECNAAARERSTLSATLPEALQHNDLFVEYEPIVWLDSGRLISVEANVRWDHRDLGELPAERFLGPAEETGLNVRLGSWVLERVCEHALRWLERSGGAPPVAAVNLSAGHFRDPELVSDVQRILRDTGMPAHLLGVGIPERAMFDHDGEPVDTLEIFAEMGLRLGVYDFGRDYTQLHRMRNLPVCGVKIGGRYLESFADPSGPDPLDEHLVSSLIGSARMLGLVVIADGVVVEEQARHLHRIGVHGAKGEYTGGLASATEIEAMIIEGRSSLS